MLPFILYFITGVATGFHVYTLLFAAYGASLNPLELVSLLGSFCLVIAAYLSLFRPQVAGRVALIACLLMCCFYGPAIANLVRARLHKPVAASQLMLPLAGETPKTMLLAESARF
jgi:hypothetical protein